MCSGFRNWEVRHKAYDQTGWSPSPLLKKMRRKHLFFLAVLLLVSTRGLCAEKPCVFEEEDITVIFDAPLRSAAREVIDMYPGIKADLERIFGWDLDLVPAVLLMRDTEQFQRLARNPMTVAFAVPEKDLVVIDHSRMNINPFSLDIILKHELCHLLLHHHIRVTLLPRWLDEGVCQWASDGIGEIIMDQKMSLLNRAARSGRFIRLRDLEKSFPHSKDRLLLAYEEIKSFIEHILGEFGTEGVLCVLENMKNGEDVHAAVLRGLSTPLETLENEWHSSLMRRVTWFTYLSYHLYDILFGLMGVIMLYAFVRAILKKKAYMEEDGEDV